MEQGALFADALPAPAPAARHSHRGPDGKFRIHPGAIPASAEVATAVKGEFLSPFSILEFPNFSEIIRSRSRGLGIKYYDMMLRTDADLPAFFRDLTDDVLHYPWTITPAAADPEHLEHADFLEFALKNIPDWQNVVRHAIESYARGFSVFEKMFEVVTRGRWRGAVVLSGLLDKPQRWFGFDPDRNLRFKTAKSVMPGEMVDQRKFLVMSFGTNSNPWGDPILDYCYFPHWLKHKALEAQAVFYEKWGMPTVQVDYDWSQVDKINQANLKKAITVMQAIQNDQAIAVPKGMLVKLLESMRSGTVSFDGYIKQLTEMESRLITGQLLTSMGAQGGSHALGKVHEKRAANKSEMLAYYVSHKFTRYVGRELIDRNYGPQDVYPEFKILAKDPVERQAEATLEQQLLANGHSMSKAHASKVFDIVPPKDAVDQLVPSATNKPGQVLPVNPMLAAPAVVVEFAAMPAHKELHAAAKAAAQGTHARLKAIGRAASAKAKPGIRSAVKGLASVVRKKKKAADVTKAVVYRGFKAINVGPLGAAHQQMFDPAPTPMTYASAGDGEPSPPEISTEAKLALALTMIGIAERISTAAADAPEGTDGGTLADSLTDPNGVAVDATFSNLFEGTHGTNIASNATAKLRSNLADPKYRAQFPYVMFVVTNPDARLSHQLMDGYILTAEDAQYSPLLPPLDFGCDCQAVPISAAQARAIGLTGAAPAGGLADFLAAKGAMPNGRGGYHANGQTVYPGTAPGFSPAMQGTDYYAQLDALRQKAEQLRREDPEAWAALQLWLVWLFDMDVLSHDPPQTDTAAA